MTDLDDTAVMYATDELPSSRKARYRSSPPVLATPAPRTPPQGGEELPGAWHRFLTGLLRALAAWPV